MLWSLQARHATCLEEAILLHYGEVIHTATLQEGFNPATFTSSRGKRADQRQQNVSDFLDEDELEELREKGLQAKAEYDTFAHESTAKSHTQAADQAAARHGLNLFPEEALKPVVNSIGVQLLQKMGWKQVCIIAMHSYFFCASQVEEQLDPCQQAQQRNIFTCLHLNCYALSLCKIVYESHPLSCCVQGRGLGFQETNNLEQMGFDLSAAEQSDESVKRSKRRRWGPMTGLQVQNSALTNLDKKKNTYGLGFDPYANSEEFRNARKRFREEAAHTQRHTVDSKGVLSLL